MAVVIAPATTAGLTNARLFFGEESNQCFAFSIALERGFTTWLGILAFNISSNALANFKKVSVIKLAWWNTSFAAGFKLAPFARRSRRAGMA